MTKVNKDTNWRRGLVLNFNFTPSVFIVDFEQVNARCSMAIENLSRL